MHPYVDLCDRPALSLAETITAESNLAEGCISGCFNHSMVTLVADKLKKHW